MKLSKNISYGQTSSRDLSDNWEIKRLKFVVECNSLSLGEETEPDYYFNYIDIGSVDLVRGIIKSELMSFENAPSRARRVVRKGDIIISTVRTYLKAIARICEDVKDTIVSTGFAVLTPNDTINSEFLGYYAQSQIFVEKIMAFSNGVTYPSINSSDLVNIFVDVPALREQQSIAAFLDYKTEQIDKLIEKKEQLLKLLEEKRIALITQAVTKGLDPNVKMKPSGIDGLGDIPEHWEVKRLRFLSNVNPVKSGLELNNQETVSFVPMDAVGEYGGIRLDEIKLVEDVYNGYTYFKDGDIVIAKITPCFENGKGALAENLENSVGFGTTELHVIRVKEKLNNKYLLYITFAHHFRNMGASEMLGAGGQKRVPEAFIKDFLIAYPSFKEQESIIEELETHLRRMYLLREKVSDAVNKLKEYRTSLITSAVTGKIDVRDFKPERV